MTVFFYVDKDLFKRCIQTNVILRSTGTVQWDSPLIVKAACALNVKEFPFDQQKCHLVFGSWTYDSRQLEIRAEYTTANVSDYEESSTWKLLLPVRANRYETKYSGFIFDSKNMMVNRFFGPKGGVYVQLFFRLLTP